ncbi:MAG TPA: succinylglutamate desuccinylase/aspartoacylase family protein [Pyrinomonadaceae bacterium]|nr:succinylglutamate desuccinylase/aspartoacylase family protein [Pyrinomonadaceae bacterium]
MSVKTAIPKMSVITEESHLIGEFIGDASGATLIVVGSLHGNEKGGAIALRKISREMENLREKLRGRVYFLAGNTRALQRGVRFIDSDLNRHWTVENFLKNSKSSTVSPLLSEDLEQRELLEIINRILATAQDEVYALDLHSTSAEGLPFATVGDTLRNRSFAQKFPVTILLGIEEQLDGTLLEYLNSFGIITFGFEGGQHDSPQTAKNHEALVWLALVNSGILAAEDAPDLERHRQNLGKATGAARLLEVRYREAVRPEDEFEMNPGFENFDTIKRGQILARNRKGAIKAVESGLILMPLYQKLGEDGFFIGREIAPFWLRLSLVLRKLKIADFMHILPGVSRHPTEREILLVDTRIARFFPLQIFHLLGFRKRRWRDNKLVVSRRRYDTFSPFKRQEK